ncbi:hypothetical protein B0H14DRAFT_3877211 [Mycena olivaceomarginata]|nr:hypothetical protein B0H14DRAFT_3877211 [Mycena olivaceomarginata]
MSWSPSASPVAATPKSKIKVSAARRVTRPPGPVAKTASSKSTAAHPSWKNIIRECIATGETRRGVSRPEIKKYAKETYKLDSTRAHVSWLNRAIASGVEDGVFVQPKGPSGCVKLAPENSTPGSKSALKPAAARKPSASQGVDAKPKAKIAAMPAAPKKPSNAAAAKAKAKIATMPAAMLLTSKGAAAKPNAKISAIPGKVAAVKSKTTASAPIGYGTRGSAASILFCTAISALAALPRPFYLAPPSRHLRLPPRPFYLAPPSPLFPAEAESEEHKILRFTIGFAVLNSLRKIWSQ